MVNQTASAWSSPARKPPLMAIYIRSEWTTMRSIKSGTCLRASCSRFRAASWARFNISRQLCGHGL